MKIPFLSAYPPHVQTGALALLAVVAFTGVMRFLAPIEHRVYQAATVRSVKAIMGRVTDIADRGERVGPDSAEGRDLAYAEGLLEACRKIAGDEAISAIGEWEPEQIARRIEHSVLVAPDP